MTFHLPKYMAPIMVFALAFLFGSCFATKPVFFQYLVTAKQWQLEQGVLLAAMILVVFLPFFRNVKITAIDAGVLLLACWFVFSAFFTHNSDYRSQHEVLFHVILWLTVYLFVRSGSRTGSGWFHWSVLGILLGIALFQSVLGLMQLYDLEASHHGLFKITGTFHNPGPFSGFIVSTLPLALFCYTTCPDLSGEKKHRGDIEKHGDKNSREISIKWLNFPIKKIWTKALKWLSLLTIIAILLIIPAAQSRAAWVAGGAGCLFVFLAPPPTIPLRDRLKTSFKRLNFWARMSIIMGIVIGIIGAGAGIYLMKKNSANGRLLIWQVTGQLIKEQPVAGHGTGAFEALYMDEQANWFESGNGTKAQAAVAGSPEAPFNEPLKLWLEKGLIGILLAGAVLGVIFFPGTFNKKPETLNYEPIKPHPIPPNPLEGEPLTRDHSTPKTAQPETRNKKLKTRNSRPNTLNSKLRYPQTSGKSLLGGFRGLSTLISGLKGTLVSILTFSLFSYPFDISSFILQLVVVVALLSSTTPALITTKGRKSLLLTMPIVVLLIAASGWYFPKRQAHYAAQKTWKEATQFYNMGSYDIATEAYEEAFPVLKNNGLFLQTFGKALSMNEQYEESNKILTLAQAHMSSYIIQNTLGDNHKALGNYYKAETAYRKSAYMVPGMLLPKYLLAKLYVESDQHQKAKQTAKNILNSPAKIESTATNEIMEEMKEIINEQ